MRINEHLLRVDKIPVVHFLLTKIKTGRQVEGFERTKHLKVLVAYAALHHLDNPNDIKEFTEAELSEFIEALFVLYAPPMMALD